MRQIGKSLSTAVLTFAVVSSFSQAALASPPIDETQATEPSPPDAVAGLTAPKLLRGRLFYSDLPRHLALQRQTLAVSVNYNVGLDGVPSDCRVIKSSGQPELDTLACELIEQRFRYSPAKDADGHVMAARIVETHTWKVRR